MISFVLQGPINPIWFVRCVKSIKLNFPYSEIIVSTYYDQDISDIPSFCTLRQSIDPGPCKDQYHENNTNLNRQIITSYKGIESASNEIVVRLRNDLIINDPNLIDKYIQALQNRKSPNGWSIFQHPILISSVYTVNPFGSLHMSGHPGDWIHVGHKKDLLALYSAPFNDTPSDEQGRLKYRSEQYPWFKLLERKGIKGIKYDTDEFNGQIDKHKHFAYFLHNFIVKDLDIYCQKETQGRGSSQEPTFISERLYDYYYSKL